MSYVHCLLCDSHTGTDTNSGVHSLLWAFALQLRQFLKLHEILPIIILVPLSAWTIGRYFPLISTSPLLDFLYPTLIIPEIFILSANVPLVHKHLVYWEKSSSFPHQCGSLPFSPLVICPSGQLKNSFPLTFHIYNVEFHVAYISINISSTPH